MCVLGTRAAKLTAVPGQLRTGGSPQTPLQALPRGAALQENPYCFSHKLGGENGRAQPAAPPGPGTSHPDAGVLSAGDRATPAGKAATGKAAAALSARGGPGQRATGAPQGEGRLSAPAHLLTPVNSDFKACAATGQLRYSNY